MKKWGVAILGLGVVGGGTYKILTENKEYYKKTQKLDITVECVLERNKQRALDLGVEEEKIASSIEEVISNPNVDVVVEVIGGVEPARTFVLKALMSGKTVVTSNKELVCKHWYELEAEAKKMNAGLLFEASCVGGVPIIRTLTEGTQANSILSLVGIINGTTNYILTKMEKEGTDYQTALKEAQHLGYAEFNPTADVEGFDAAYKLSILSSLAFSKRIPLENVYREGITKITGEDIAYGKKLGYKIKLLAIGKNTDAGIEVRVHPAFVPADSMIASVNDSFNAVKITGDSVGEVMLYGRGAGALPTGSAIVSDIIFAGKHPEISYATFENTKEADKSTKFVSDFTTKYFIRLTVEDKSGVLCKIAGVFAKYGVSLKEVKQDVYKESGVPLVIITHETQEFSVRKTLEKLEAMEEVFSVDSLIRVEE